MPTPSRVLAFLLLVPIAFAACDRSPTEPSVDGLIIGEIVLEMDDGSYAYSHIDHWHGAPVLRVGQARRIRFHFVKNQLSSTDHDIPGVEDWFTLQDHPDYEVHAVIEHAGLATWTGDRVEGLLRGEGEGASRISFVVRRGPTTIYEAPPLNFRVREPAND